MVLQREALDLTQAAASMRAAAVDLVERAEKARRVAVEVQRLATSVEVEARRALDHSSLSHRPPPDGPAGHDANLFLQAVFAATEAGHRAKRHKGEWLLGHCDCLEVARITVEAAESALPDGYFDPAWQPPRT
jgi:hypothetical protein